MPEVVEGNRRLDPSLNVKEGLINAVDLGDRAKEYRFDLDDANQAKNVAVLDPKEGSQEFQDILKLDGGPRHLNNDLGLLDADGNLSVELIALIRAAVDEDASDGIEIVGTVADAKATGEIKIAIEGDWSVDHFVFSGDKIAAFLDPAGAAALTGSGVDLKDRNSQTAVFDFETQDSIFSGDDSFVQSAAAKEILSGSRLTQEEATALVELAIAGDEDVRFTESLDGGVLEVDAGSGSTDTVIITNADFDFI
jgi:hypothetical protein